MTEILGKLFGSVAKVKIMRLFLLNPEQGFESSDIATRSRVSRTQVRSEIANLLSIGFIQKKKFSKDIEVKKGKKITHKQKRVEGYIFNSAFEYKYALQDLLVDAEFLTKEDIAKRFKPLGKIKLLLTAGVFTRDPDSRLDLLVVGDVIRRGAMESTIRMLEAEIGKELTYAIFETPEFLYRANMYDKLVRDVIDYPHERVIDSGLLSQVPKQ